ncbi:hypothetical protein SeLEV6574_g06561 [Synchytrium endobioticum]|nr:hypothetical protein SeLEV6574_g06561 [Synchytrium endobioticum]
MEEDVRDTHRRAVRTLETFWIQCSSKRHFKLIKDLITKSERSMTWQFAKRLSREESELLRDPFMQARVRLRLGGESFPPTIFFKIFTKTQTHYYSAKRLIQPGSVAARDSLKCSGRWPFLKHVLDVHFSSPVDSVDITSQAEFVQFMSSLDSRSAHIGGRQNGWRVIGLNELLPQHSQRVHLKQRWVSIQGRKSPARQSSNGSNHTKHSSNPNKVTVKQEVSEIDDDFEDLYEWTISLDD